jgi:hypothetical protein
VTASRKTSRTGVKQIAGILGCLLLLVLLVLGFPFLLVFGFYLIPVALVVGIVIMLLRRRRR